MTPVEILKGARDLISDPRRWTRGFLARNAIGEPVCPTFESAVCFCAMGAIAHVANGSERNYETEWLVAKHCGGGLGEFNDSHDHAEVLALFDKAIASAQP